MKLCRKLQGGWRRLSSRRAAPDANLDRGLFGEMRTFVWAMCALQMWPLFEKRGQVVFRKRSLYFAYAVVSWTGTSYIAFRALAHWYSVIQASGYFSLKAYYTWFFLVGHFCVAIPLLFWTNMRGVAEAFNYAQRFQANFLRVTGSRLSFGVAKKARAVGALSPVVGVTLVFWSHGAGYVPWNQFPVYEVNATYLVIVPETWLLIALALETAAQRLRAELVQVVLDGGGGGAEASQVAQLRALWLQLQHLLRLWSRALSPCLAHLLLSSVIVLLLSVFGIAIPLLRHQVIDDRLAGMMTAVFHNLYNINRICSTGSRVRREVKDAFVKEMTKAKIAADHTAIYTELVRFLKAIDIHGPYCNMGGFTSLDRALAVGCASIVLTYVVVLMQFAFAKGAY